VYVIPEQTVLSVSVRVHNMTDNITSNSYFGSVMHMFQVMVTGDTYYDLAYGVLLLKLVSPHCT